MGRRAIISILILLCCIDLSAQKVTFIPQWTPQSQFAGYYLAKEKGYYSDEGLDVDIRHIGQNSSESLLDILKMGEAQIVGQQLIQSIISRSAGLPLVNILQLTEYSGLWCVSREPISDPSELNGKKVGKWKVGYSDFCEMLEVSRGIDIDWVPFLSGINLYVFGAVDAMLCYSYSEFIALKLALGDIPDDHILKFSDFGYECPEDGLYVMEDYYNSNRDTIDKFVRATKKGWEYARSHRAEALNVTMHYINAAHVVSNMAHQSMMLDTYLDMFVNPKTGVVDYAPVDKGTFDDIVRGLLMTGGVTNKVEYNELIKNEQ